MNAYFWLIPILPGLAAALNGLAPKATGRMAGHLAVLAMLGSLAISSMALFAALTAGHAFQPIDIDYFTWIGVGGLNIPFGVYVDQLSLVMMMVVSFVGSVIFIYATGYMHGDPGYVRFFTYLPLFTFFMFLLVMGNSLPLLFVGWEGVGLCSYLLIGYFYDRDYAAAAGMKAFIVNRIGDFGFLLGMLLLFWYTGSLKFTGLFEAAPGVFTAGGAVITVITLLLFVGATGKSAQLPLYVWLPDAMAGPTPVSALIHAATMVTAGIYMIARLNPLFSMAPVTLLVVGTIGGLTALFAASIALVQRDSKKILAYSTVSQLGYMFLALGSGAYIAAIFHLMTHAFFKACLFLGAGSVLHAFHRDTDVDVFEAGGLRKYMPYTRATFLIATIAISGIPPLAGFWSKDEILWEAFAAGRVFLWFLGILAAFCTAFYMFRLYNLLFSGEFRGTEDQRHHLHESPAVMWLPLAVLAAFSICIGCVNMPLLGYTGFHDFLHPVFAHGAAHGAEAVEENAFLASSFLSEHMLEWIFAGISVVVAVVAILFARVFYVWFPNMPERMREAFSSIHTILFNKYYVDEMYHAGFIQTYFNGCGAANWFDNRVIIAGLNGLANTVRGLADRLRRIQTGLAPHYALGTLAGMVFLVVVFLLCY
ncbi:MAG: NADH-quinone oxidoreductase subunit L [bacterium]|nr:NADH-quinone oxidoreductase subunit L [bacterium]